MAPDLRAESLDLESNPCSDGFTATRSGSPGSRPSAVQEYSDFHAECKTTATVFSSDPVLGLQVMQ